MKTKKKLFIDAGSNKGQAYDRFSKTHSLEEHDYYLIEPNEKCIQKLKNKTAGKNVFVLNKALYISDSPRTLYGRNEAERDKMGQGLSLLRDHNTLWYKAKPVEESVECIDVSSFLREMSEKYEEIYMKLDIESSEYEVLEKIIEDKVYTKIKKIWVEWHDRYMKKELRQKYQEREKKIVKYLQSHGIKVSNWH